MGIFTVKVWSFMQGSLVVVDGQKLEILTRLKARPGLRAIRFAPDGRWGLVVNAKENGVHILDASNHRILQTVEVGKGPDQVSFTRTFAYIRSADTEKVSMIRLSDLGKGGDVPVLTFPGGQTPPGQSPPVAVAGAIVPGLEGSSVFVANPADRIIYPELFTNRIEETKEFHTKGTKRTQSAQRQ